MMEAMTDKALFTRMRTEISKLYKGTQDTIDVLLVALIAGGHVLIEGLPGLAKTTLARALSQCISGDFKRIQFTMDLLPSDITGSSIYRMNASIFEFIPGPIFANVILADEINRAPSKTQSALLEAMQESQVTVDAQTHLLERPFIVLATQNPDEAYGTYPLPEAQLDRFLFRLRLGYPSAEEELEIIQSNRLSPPELDHIISKAQAIELIESVDAIEIHDKMAQYIVTLIRTTRQIPDLERGASPRAGTALLRASKARAILKGRGYVTPDDVQWACPLVLNHRLIAREDATRSVDELIELLLKHVAFS